MEISDWIVGGMLGLAVACVNNLWFRVRKLEGENKDQAEKITWLHKRCEKLEAFNIESFVGGANPQWQYDALRKQVTRETSEDRAPLNGS